MGRDWTIAGGADFGLAPADPVHARAQITRRSRWFALPRQSGKRALETIGDYDLDRRGLRTGRRLFPCQSVW